MEMIYIGKLESLIAEVVALMRKKYGIIMNAEDLAHIKEVLQELEIYLRDRKSGESKAL